MPKIDAAPNHEASPTERDDVPMFRKRYRNRSQVAEASPTEQLDRLDDTRLETECKKLDPAEERHFAEEGLAGDSSPKC